MTASRKNSAADPDRETGEESAWDAPVLIVSAGRSGSTWLASILSTDERLGLTHESGIPELLGATRSLARLPLRARLEASEMRLVGLLSEKYRGSFDRMHRAALRELIVDFYRDTFRDRALTRWGDKLRQPEAIPFVLEEFPRARVLHLVRDGRDQVVSMQNYLVGRGERAESDLEHGFASHCDYWVHTNELIQAHAAAGEQSLLVRYEDLVRDPWNEVARIFAFLGLTPGNPTRNYLASGDEGLRASHATSASVQASIGRWRSELSRAEQRIAEERMGPLLRRLGYDSRDAT